IDNLIDYMMIHLFAEVEDWPNHNWYAAHHRATNGEPATKWIFLIWDQDIALDQLVRRNRIDVNNNDTPARIYSQLRAWPEFRREFGDRVQKHLFNGGALTSTNNIARMMNRAARIDRAILAESARWGDARKNPIGANPGTGTTFTRNETWLPELQKLYTNFFPKLTETNLTRFRGGSLSPAIDAPVFNQNGGSVTQGFSLTITNGNATGVIYYTVDGTDPRQFGTASVAPTARAYTSPIPINAVTQVRARILSNGTWSALVEAVFYPPQDLSKLVLTEIMYNPPAFGSIVGNDLEFLELKNVGTNTLDLSGLTFAGITFTFPNGTTLVPNRFFVLARNASAFAAKYPGVTVNGVFGGQLDNGGETLTLTLATGANVLSVTYDDVAPWPVAPDGYGFSLVPIIPGLTQASDDGSKWRSSTSLGGSPGADDPAPTLPHIVISEILQHTDPPQKDSVELFNPTATPANIGGWYLTDSVLAPKKFRIPANTIIPAGGYIFFDEDDFNASIGTNVNFAFSSIGEEVYLFSAEANGELSGYDYGFAFGPMFNGVSIGRYVNSAGEEFFPRQTAITLGVANSGPRIGPIVINEIQYNPDANGVEFIELLNVTGNPVPLFDPAVPTNTWRVGGISYTFPTNIILGPSQLLVLVATNPAAFVAKFSVSNNVQVLGPFLGSLDNNGERLTLEAPDTPNTNAVPYVVVEEVRYDDKAPWPPGADGSGLSLQRISPTVFGNEPTNWIAVGQTPGSSKESADTDGDGIPDNYELANGLDPFTNDSDKDSDGDGATNLEEYRNGTNPQMAQNFYRLGIRRTANRDFIILDFYTLPGKTYIVERADNLSITNWTGTYTQPGATNAKPVSVTNAISSGQAYYRLRIQ
ncbi:MAG: lamin tail domain-containing protein, partial [Verrucomicrobiota bacterium]